MATDPQSISNVYQNQEEVAKVFANIIYNIVNRSKKFCSENFLEYDLHLCEAFCLIWQNAETGEVDGRCLGIPLKISVFAALFIDLVTAKRIEIFKDHHGGDPCFRVINDRPIDTFLDIAVFDHIRSLHKHHRLRDTKIWKWLERAEEMECVECTFDSLVARGILKKKNSGILGIFKRFPTLNPVPEKELEKKIQDIAFFNQNPDSYMLALLILSRESDRIFMCKDPILRKHFSKEDYNIAKQNLDKVLLSFLDE